MALLLHDLDELPHGSRERCFKTAPEPYQAVGYGHRDQFSFIVSSLGL